MTAEQLFKLALGVQFFSTFAMTGLIYLVQFVHYPLFDRVEASRFAQFERDHSNWITFIVLPLMLAELTSAAYLMLSRMGQPDRTLWAIGLGLVLMLWLSTFFLSVPQHTRLMDGFDPTAHRRLVVTNWPRTVLWTLRSGLLLYAMATLLTVRPPVAN